MKETVNICVIGLGNISNSRHIPALKKMKNVNIVGGISDDQAKIDKTVAKYHIPNTLLINDPKNDIKKLEKCDWFQEVDGVIIGTPPKQHYPLVKMCLLLGKHVLVEKPMMMNKKEADELIELAKKKHLIFCVVHNFQYASKMQKLNEVIESKKYGEILSITEVQFTNRNRRLPLWYDDLPLGLFYDEAAHFIYLLERHGGKLKIDDVHATYHKKESTPLSLSVCATAGKVPVQMILNFNSPVCEWYYIVNFKDEIFIYDFFKDILVQLHTDNEHLSKDILHNDLAFTFKYWASFIANGFKMITGNLLYGHDVVIGNFVKAIQTGEKDDNISAEQGRKNVISMNEIVEKANQKK